MKHFFTALILVFTYFSASAIVAEPVVDSTYVIEQAARIDRLQEQVQSLSTTVSRLRQQISQQSQKQESLESSVSTFDSKLTETNNTISSTSESLQGEIAGAKEYVDIASRTNDKKLFSRTLIGAVLIILLLLLSALIYALLKKRISATSDVVESVRKAQASLQEESIKLDEKLLSLFDSQLAGQSVKPEEDHSLVLKIANELARMETNLSRMESTVKGHKQLSSAVKRIKENLLANGYEFVDMLGKPYHEGMVVDADFVTSEDIEEGSQIITGVTKPQVNYNGKMIQSAKITVSQNI